MISRKCIYNYNIDKCKTDILRLGKKKNPTISNYQDPSYSWLIIDSFLHTRLSSKDFTFNTTFVIATTPKALLLGSCGKGL